MLVSNINGTRKLGDIYKVLRFDTFEKTGDLYCLFYEKSTRLLKEHGSLAFITSNTWMRASYGESLRRFLAMNTNPILLVDFVGQKVFNTATVECSILLLSREKNIGKTKACSVTEKLSLPLSAYVDSNCFIQSYCTTEGWIIRDRTSATISEKIQSIGIPLSQWDIEINYGIKTGLNQAFIIDGKTKQQILAINPEAECIIRPVLRGRDMKRYQASFADRWIINAHNGVKEKHIPRVIVDDYPAIKEHLDVFLDSLEKRQDRGDTPYNLRSCAYLEALEMPKVIWGELSDEPKFVFDKEGKYIPLNTGFFMVGEHLKYLLAFLNSPVSKYYFTKNIATTSGVGTIRWLKYTIASLPVPRPDLLTEQEIIGLVNEALDTTVNSEILNRINRLVYSVYGFSDEEIKAIESM